MTMTQDVAVRILTGTQKAALVLMNMSTDRAAAVLRNFSPEEQQEITAEMARMRSSNGIDAERAIQEFQEVAVAPASSKPAAGGKAVATKLIRASFEPDRAAEMVEHLDQPASASTFAFLEAASVPEIVRLLQHESPETVAFVLVQLAPGFAAKVLMQHDAQRRIDIAQCVATMGTPVPEAGAVVADVLKTRSRRAKAPAVVQDEEDGPQLHVQPLVDIMNHANPAEEGELMEGLRGRDSSLADEVRAKMLAFEDLPRIEDRDLQQILRGVDVGQLALALKGAAEEIADVIKANMSERNRQTLAEEAAELGRVPKSQVEEARNVIVRAVRSLASTGDGIQLKKVVVEGEEPVAEAEAEPEEEYVD